MESKVGTKITLNESQQAALDKMESFVDSSDRVFILKGYAGTGKTTLMRFMIESLQKKNVPYKLLSTTGRAAKILSNYTGYDASTIHSMIYSYKDFNKDMSECDPEKVNIDETGQLYLVFEPAKLNADAEYKCIYIVDEASMISDTEVHRVVQAQFGTGRLLKELLDYDKCPGSKYIFVGDPCQLPPIDGTFSPALDSSYIKNMFGYGVQESTLTQIMRQSDGNTIVNAAATLRSAWSKAPESDTVYGDGQVWGFFNIRQYPDIHLCTDFEQMKNCNVLNIRQNGYNDSVMICRSNSDCQKVSSIIRQQLGFTGVVSKGDLLLVIQNQMTTGLMNGDMVEVVNVSDKPERTISTTNLRGYRTELVFREVRVRELFTKREYSTLLLETTINLQQNNLDPRQQTGLFLDFILRMRDKGITQKKNKSLFDHAMREDPYLNALRCSYGYAITCHKAQGGEWNNVYVYISKRNITRNPTKSVYQWAYTAITRGKRAVYLIDEFYIR